MSMDNFAMSDLMITIVSILGACGVFMGIVFKSKCKKIRLCWGCIDCIRDTDAIAQLEKEELQLKEKQLILKNKNRGGDHEMPTPEAEIP